MARHPEDLNRAAPLAHAMNHPPSPDRTDRLLQCLQMALGHELPNRLVALQGLLRVFELEAADTLNPEQQDYLRRLTSLTRRSHALVAELSALVRAVHVPQPAAAVNLAEVLQEAAAEVKKLCPEASVDYHVAPDGPPLTAPPLALRQTLASWLKAAAQAAGPGRPLRVEAGASRLGGDQRLWLRDDGPGWPAERLAQLFEPFTAAPAEGDDPGLGLYPVRHLAEGWGASLTVESEPGRGSTFIIAWNVP